MHAFTATALLTRWANFYVIAGSAAAALTGLQFVVVALGAQMRLRSLDEGIEAFSSPTVVYFSTVLLLSAVLCAPWDGLAGLAALVALCGAAGVGYTGLVLVGHPVGALFTIAAATLLLLVIGIHNAWDTVTYLVLNRLDDGRHD